MFWFWWKSNLTKVETVWEEKKKPHQFHLLCEKVCTQLSVCFKKEDQNNPNKNNKTVRRNNAAKELI